MLFYFNRVVHNKLNLLCLNCCGVNLRLNYPKKESPVHMYFIFICMRKKNNILVTKIFSLLRFIYFILFIKCCISFSMLELDKLLRTKKNNPMGSLFTYVTMESNTRCNNSGLWNI